MRNSFGFVLVAVLTACSSHSSVSGEVPVEVAYPPDATIDSSGGDDSGGGGDSGGEAGEDAGETDAAPVDATPDAPPPDAPPPVILPDIQIVTPGVDINPGAELIYCYYFHTSNTSELAIKKWASHLNDGVRQLIVFFTRTDQQTPGTLTTSPCGMASGIGPVWTYSAVDVDATAALPADDGHGQPVAQMIS